MKFLDDAKMLKIELKFKWVLDFFEKGFVVSDFLDF